LRVRTQPTEELEDVVLRQKWASGQENGFHPNTNTIAITNRASLNPKMQFYDEHLWYAKNQTSWGFVQPDEFSTGTWSSQNWQCL
jgi:hypothetical protein